MATITERILAALGIVALVAFAVGLLYMFHLRFSAGDIYPPYSSLRYDPLGCSALLESYDACPGVSAGRNHERLSTLHDGRNAALVAPGIHPLQLDYVLRGAALFVQDGGRLVITLFPMSSEESPGFSVEEDSCEECGNNEKDSEDASTDSDENDGETDKGESQSVQGDEDPVDMEQAIEIGFSPVGADAEAVLVLPPEGDNLPGMVPCHTAVCFTNLDESWNVIYERDGYPVVLYRRQGEGSVVVSALSYPLSNEALKNDLMPGLLAWLVDDCSTIIFDESMKGVVHARGIMELCWKYRLQWGAAWLALIAGLFLWRISLPFVPRTGAEGASNPAGVSGRSSLAALTNLLRRNISPVDLVDVCVDEWSKTCRPSEAERDQLKADVRRSLLDLPASRDSAAVYNRIAEFLKERRMNGR